MGAFPVSSARRVRELIAEASKSQAPGVKIVSTNDRSRRRFKTRSRSTHNLLKPLLLCLCNQLVRLACQLFGFAQNRQPLFNAFGCFEITNGNLELFSQI